MPTSTSTSTTTTSTSTSTSTTTTLTSTTTTIEMYFAIETISQNMIEEEELPSLMGD